MPRRKSTHTVWPPPPPDNETKEERRTRLKNEIDAKCKSDAIDLQLKLEREERQQKLSGIKVLLLGQAESGKSTVLKNFQFHFAPKAFELEAEIWRPVIQLNLIRSVNFILAFVSDWNSGLHKAHAHHHMAASNSLISPKIRTLCLRLAPLRAVEEDFVRVLSRWTSPETHNSVYALDRAVSNGWKQLITLFRRAEGSITAPNKSHFDRSEDEPNRRVLVALGEDIAALWQDESLQHSLKLAEITLEEQPGFFLDHAVRVTREDYKPSPDDVLKARVTTVGPEAHTIVAEGLSGSGLQWTIYDVGGSCNQRATWAQFFDDVNAIIFLAPLSGFNQFLAEDETVNRLTDSLRLWQLICSNKLLASVQIVLFLNKMDILDAKLKSGIQFSSFVTSYVNSNETKHVTQYLLNLFTATHEKYSPKRRKLHSHFTCAVDTKATANIINKRTMKVQDIIYIKLLSNAEIL